MYLDIEVKGIEKVKAQASRAALGRALRRFLTRATILLQGLAREGAPVDTGRLRSSITTQVDNAPIPLWGKVGTNVKYAPFMEYGTGLMSDYPGGGSGKVHHPPGAALQPWATRHGFASGYAVAWVIAKRGGLRPRRYLRGALARGRAKVLEMAKEIVKDMKAGT